MSEPRPPRGTVDLTLAGAVALLLCLGAVMVYSSSFVTAYTTYREGDYWFLRHLQWLGLGTVLLVVCAAIDYRRWRWLALPGLAASVVFLVAVVAIPAISPEVSGARRWVYLGPIPAFQPSEITKLTLAIFLAWWLRRGRGVAGSLARGVLPTTAVTLAIAALVLKEPDLGTAMVLVAMAAAVYLVAGARPVHLIPAAGLGLAGLLILIFSASYRLQRVTAYLDPWRDPLNVGYHPVQALLALGSGGITGVGLGASRQKFSWLPAPHTDTIFAVIGEELGLVGAIMVLGLFVTIAARGYSIAWRSPDGFGALLATAITTWLVFQALVNVGVVTTLLPFTGIPLPFVSYGGSSLAVSMAATGILLSISRQLQSVPAAEGRRAAVPAGARAVDVRGSAGGQGRAATGAGRPRGQGPEAARPRVAAAPGARRPTLVARRGEEPR